jgi:hypothetical protein
VRAAAGRSKNPARRSLNVGREGAGEDAYGKAPSDRDMVGAVARGLQDSHVAAESSFGEATEMPLTVVP